MSICVDAEKAFNFCNWLELFKHLLNENTLPILACLLTYLLFLLTLASPFKNISEIISQKSYLRNHISETISQKSYLRNHISEIISQKSYLRNHISETFRLSQGIRQSSILSPYPTSTLKELLIRYVISKYELNFHNPLIPR